MTVQEPHPIKLEQLFFTRSVVIAVPSHEAVPGSVLAAPENDLDARKAEGREGFYTASMRTLINPSMDTSLPYSIDMECVAFFAVDGTLSDADALRGVTITAHSVLYGAIREATAWLTGRQAYGTLMLGLSVLRPKAPEVKT